MSSEFLPDRPPRPARTAPPAQPEDPGRRECLRCLGIGGAALLALPTRLQEFLPRCLPGSSIEAPHEAGSVANEQPRTVHPDAEKQLRFDEAFDDDFLLGAEELEVLASVVARLGRVRSWVGHGHFNLIGFETALRHAAARPEIGGFPPREVAFLEELFSRDARDYGFLGDKVLHRLGAEISERQVEKIPGTGHYLLRGPSLDKYRQIVRDLGSGVVLTSGVRGVAKQFHLFLEKAESAGGNLSLASRSLAPPGYSYHAAGDFDVGTVGLGSDNFTARFSETREYRKLLELGYVGIRYPELNPYGVRFEPWHVRAS